MDQELVKISKAVSYALRHAPEKLGIKLDKEGWTNTVDLITQLNLRGYDVDFPKLKQVVDQNDKQRFALTQDGLRIRANQGHSVKDVDLGLNPTLPPKRLYHGTQTSFLPLIHKDGLKAMSRNHVHLSTDVETATKVAKRRGPKITILVVNSERMNSAGLKFYKSDNGVWLTDEVPAQYIEFK